MILPNRTIINKVSKKIIQVLPIKIIKTKGNLIIIKKMEKLTSTKKSKEIE